jgi:hypothetical protein
LKELLSTTLFAFSGEPWSRLTPLCRRICLLRAQGLTAAADDLHATEFIPILAALRTEYGPASQLDDERVNLLYAIEQERVANAMLLAELIKPLITTSAASAAPPPAPARAVPAPVAHPRTAPSMSIADLLDDMLARERPASSAARA